MDVIASVILDIAIVMIAARVFGWLAQRVGQPKVLGEIIAGIALGPSLLGLLPGHLDRRLFSPTVLPYLSVFSQVGLVLFMFVVGLELDVRLIRGRTRQASTISMCSIAVPFVLGGALGFVLYRSHSRTVLGQVSPICLCLFLGVAMSITAFPVLARIISDRGLQRHPIGVLALSSAAVDDILAWTLLAVVVAVAQGRSPLSVLRVLLLTAGFIAVMFGILKPCLRGLSVWYSVKGRVTPELLAVVLIGLMLSACATEFIGIHAIFGAFVFGAVMPRQGAEQLSSEVLGHLKQVTSLLMLPLFFVVTGLSTNIGGVSARESWQLVVIIVVAVLGKFVGAYGGARLSRVPTREAATISVLMNTRGLTELIILTLGRQLGVLDSELFTMMVVMAVVTTAMTGPLLTLMRPRRRSHRLAAERRPTPLPEW